MYQGGGGIWVQRRLGAGDGKLYLQRDDDFYIACRQILYFLPITLGHTASTLTTTMAISVEKILLRMRPITRQIEGTADLTYRDNFNSTLVASSHFSWSGWKALTSNNWQAAPRQQLYMGPRSLLYRAGLTTDQNNDRPNLTNAGSWYTHAKYRSGPSANAQYISSAVFTQNAAGTFGDSGRFA